MKIIADLHIHSRFSRATSKELDFVALHRAALEKGIGLVGTGDFTHPGWMAEITEQLEPAEQGLFRVKNDFRRKAEAGLPRACRGEVRFVLQVEISNIYKKEEKTRKNHNLVFVRSLDVAKRISERLASIGNVASDGRPILGLDARDLLEITLESDSESFLVPAHIWTPWFSMLGSKSGFDSIGECFRDLKEHIFAAETGLSSDPPMNWRLSSLDNITLISNSDAHSPAKLGREANLLDIELGFEPLRKAIESKQGFLGTIEFFPEEGKYHLDGHRKCGVRLGPEKTRELGGRCPVCNGKLTVGVMSRVLDLADRPEGFKPVGAPGFKSLVPLDEIAGQALGVGPSTKKARALVDRVLNDLGPELVVLKDVPLEDLEAVGGSALKEAIRRIRLGELSIDAGYDGEFGTVRIFEPGELDRLMGQMAFAEPRRERSFKKAAPPDLAAGFPTFSRVREKPPAAPKEGRLPFILDDPLAGLNSDQRRAAEAETGPLLVVAGPGTGKTQTLAARIAFQVKKRAVRPDQALAVAFTNQAALELEERIAKALPGNSKERPLVSTFHGLGLSLLREFGEAGNWRVLQDDERLDFMREACGSKQKKKDVETLIHRISSAKQSKDPRIFLKGEHDAVTAYERYEALKDEAHLFDVDDLVLKPFELLSRNASLARAVAERFKLVCIDEYQDINDVQAAFVKLLSQDGRSLFAIGDPLQAIYGFRGAAPGHFDRFAEQFPGTLTVNLSATYRLTDKVLAAAGSVVGRGDSRLKSLKVGPPVEVVSCPTPKSEAEQVVVRLERIVGGTSYFAVDSGRGGDAEESDVGFGDAAVLSRTKAQQREIVAALGQSGIPCRAIAEDEPHDPRSQKVAVMTMHASKGREFEIVFATGVEPGLVPLEIEGLTSDPEEERRLLYVAVTRAKRLAVLSYSSSRSLFGRRLPGGPSPFLSKLPDNAVIRTSPVPPKKKPSAKQLSLF
jgi:DNA helicase-2/ATP-dependent DNA helicase PcrA